MRKKAITVPCKVKPNPKPGITGRKILTFMNYKFSTKYKTQTMENFLNFLLKGFYILIKQCIRHPRNPKDIKQLY